MTDKTQLTNAQYLPSVSDLQHRLEDLQGDLIAEKQKRQQVEERLSRREHELAVERQKRRLLERELRIKEGRAAKLLSPYRLSDYIRLIWWILVCPNELKAYVATLTDREFNMLQRQISWLISSLLWGPVFLWVAVPWTTEGLDLIPSSAATLLGSIIFAWVLVGILGIFENGIVAFGTVVTTAVIMLITITVTTGISDVELSSIDLMLWVGVFAMVCALLAVTISAVCKLEIAEIVSGVVAVIIAGGIVLILFNSRINVNIIDVVLIVVSAALLVGVAQERYKRLQ